MIRRILRILLYCLAFSLMASALWLTWREYGRYLDAHRLLPPGSVIAGIPAGGMTGQEAGTRLVRAYLLEPVQAQLNGEVIEIRPQDAGFQLDLSSMLSAAEESSQFTFQDYLFNRLPGPVTVDLQASLDRAKLQALVSEEIAPQFDLAPAPARPASPGGVAFLPAQGGEALNSDQAAQAIAQALFSLDRRSVDLSILPVAAPQPEFDMLPPVLEAILQSSGFDGVAELYLQDLQTGKEIQMAYDQDRPIPPEVAFTAASTIKIPVMVAAFHHMSDYPPSLQKQMELMIDVSDNGSTDEVMKRSIDENLAPLQVTADMQALGLKDTFLAGMFYTGAPLLKRFDTPANTRKDLSTDPDPYNQTTPADMGRLLAWINACADTGSGPLIETFQGQVSQQECQQMIDMLKKNRKAVLIEAGLPEGSVMAHKYGWVTDPADGLMHTLSDAAIVYTPGGNFVLSIYLYHPNQLLWDSATELMARLTNAAVHYYGLLTSR